MSGAARETADAIVLGAGAVGVCAALALQRDGRDVVLVDRDEPGRGTSFGNAGVVSRGSVLPLNNPSLPRALPGLLLGRRAGLEISLRYLAARPLWALRFLAECAPSRTHRRASALNQLLDRSRRLFPELLAAAGAAHRLRETGWLKLYRDGAPSASSDERRLLAEFGVRFEAMTGAEAKEFEPALSGVHQGALWIKDTASLDDPGETVRALARLFVDAGGRLLLGDAAVAAAASDGRRWSIDLADGRRLASDVLVVALGPWSRDWLKRVGLSAPLAYERGAHREFLAGPVPLGRPIADVDGAFVLSPMDGRWRLTCGVELAERDAPRRPTQLDRAEASMREAVSVGARRSNEDWLGARPTLPDSLPAIGPTKRAGLFVAFGHQHIGVSSAPGTGELLADLVAGRRPGIDPSGFAPSRYGF